MTESLDTLRSKLAALDRELLKIVSERETLASRIGAVKRELGLPTRDYAQERDVVERARKTALELGSSPELAESLMLRLIRSALTVQERERVQQAAGGTGRRALIIGGAGKMGRWFASFLGSQGFVVEIADPASPEPLDWRESDLSHDVIVIAAPLVVSNAILLEMANRTPTGLVFDVGSLKSPLRSGLKAMAAAGARITSLHPMFGPDTELLSGRHVVFVDVGVPEATAAAKELFASTLAVEVAMDLESHDRLIAYVLGLSHALNIAFFTALADSGEQAPELQKLSSTTFDEQLGVARKVAQENPGLYFEIQWLNDYGDESLAALLYAVEQIRSVIRAGDAAGFAALMERGRAYLSGARGPDSEGE